MEKQTKITPKDFFLWVGAMVALYVSVISFVALWFAYIERLVGDVVVLGYDPFSDGMRFAIASIIVIFPVYIFLTRMLNQEIRKHPEKKELWVRKWLVFLTVFAAGIALLIDLIVLINTYLGGQELTAAFLLKVLAVFIIVGAVFYYYLKMIRGYWDKRESTSKMIGTGVVIVVVASIVAGFFIMGSPQTQRELRNDNQRINDLQTIQFAVTDYYRNKQELPESLDVLKDPLESRFIPLDPLAGRAYEYERVGDLTFTVCATFSRALPEVPEGADTSDWRVREALEQQQDWAHGEGRTCFERTIDPDNYRIEGVLLKESVPTRF